MIFSSLRSESAPVWVLHRLQFLGGIPDLARFLPGLHFLKGEMDQFTESHEVQ